MINNYEIPHRTLGDQGKSATAVAQLGFHPKLLLLRCKEVEKKTGLCRSSIYAKLDPQSASYDNEFPVPIRIGANSVRWIEPEVDVYIASRPRTRKPEGGAR